MIIDGVYYNVCHSGTVPSVAMPGVPNSISLRATADIPRVPFWDYTRAMRVIALRTIKKFIESKREYADSREPALAWYRQVLRADWASPAEVKRDIGNASILKDGRIIFNIAGNKYRIVARINYPYRVVYIRFVGTHGQYDKIDAQTI